MNNSQFATKCMVQNKSEIKAVDNEILGNFTTGNYPATRIKSSFYNNKFKIL